MRGVEDVAAGVTEPGGTRLGRVSCTLRRPNPPQQQPHRHIIPSRPSSRRPPAAGLCLHAPFYSRAPAPNQGPAPDRRCPRLHAKPPSNAAGGPERIEEQGCRSPAGGLSGRRRCAVCGQPEAAAQAPVVPACSGKYGSRARRGAGMRRAPDMDGYGYGIGPGFCSRRQRRPGAPSGPVFGAAQARNGGARRGFLAEWPPTERQKRPVFCAEYRLTWGFTLNR